MDLCISPNPESSLMPLLVSCGKAGWCWRKNPATSSHSPTEILHLSFCSTPTCSDYGSFFKIPISLFFTGAKITSRLSYVISHVRIPFMLWTPITEAERRVGPVQEPSQMAKVSRLKREPLWKLQMRDWSGLQLLSHWQQCEEAGQEIRRVCTTSKYNWEDCIVFSLALCSNLVSFEGFRPAPKNTPQMSLKVTALWAHHMTD